MVEQDMNGETFNQVLEKSYFKDSQNQNVFNIDVAYSSIVEIDSFALAD